LLTAAELNAAMGETPPPAAPAAPPAPVKAPPKASRIADLEALDDSKVIGPWKEKNAKGETVFVTRPTYLSDTTRGIVRRLLPGSVSLRLETADGPTDQVIVLTLQQTAGESLAYVGDFGLNFQIADDSGTAVVSASTGAGKIYVMVDSVEQLLVNGQIVPDGAKVSKRVKSGGVKRERATQAELEAYKAAKEAAGE